MLEKGSLTSSRIGRLSKMGQLAGGLASGAIAQAIREVISGNRPTVGDVLLTPGNLKRVSNRLSELRGAAMKIGQLLSLDSGQILPPQLTALLSNLRANATPMPLGEVGRQLDMAWGRSWQSRFSHFDFSPIAAASIGQVHRAKLKDNRNIAVKIQYPNIEESIDSDVDNVSMLINMLGLVPDQLDLTYLLEEAKRQLHLEADYLREARAIRSFRHKLYEDDRFNLPGPIDGLTSHTAFAMEFMEGQPIETVADLKKSERERVAAAIVELALKEVFDWGLVQTDPNFANYLYDHTSGRISLLDFGATRRLDDQTRSQLRELTLSCIYGGKSDIAKNAAKLGYLMGDESTLYKNSVAKLLLLASEPLRAGGSYRFVDDQIADRMKSILIEMRMRRDEGSLPPPDILFLHRKLGGLYLLLSRLQVNIPVGELAEQVLHQENFSTPESSESSLVTRDGTHG